MQKVKFLDVFEDVTRQATKLQTKDYHVVGKYAIVDQGQDKIAGYTIKTEGIYNKTPIIIFGDHTRIFKYIDFPFFLGADGVKVLSLKRNDFYLKYLYYCLLHENIPNTGYNRHFKWLKDIAFNLIPLTEQKAIAEKLDKVSILIEKRKQQLSILDTLVKSQFIEMFGDFDLRHTQSNWLHIGKMATVVGGSTPKTENAKYWGGDYCWITPAELADDSFIVQDTIRKITKEGVNSCSLKKLPVGTVLLSSRAPIGKVAITGVEMYCNQGFKNLICSKSLNPIYVYYLLKFNTDYLNSLGRGATFKEISKSIVENILIPIPLLDVQNKFADFVKKTDKLKEKIKHSLAALELLKKSLMQKYFG